MRRADTGAVLLEAEIGGNWTGCRRMHHECGACSGGCLAVGILRWHPVALEGQDVSTHIGQIDGLPMC